jgi:hypothetical protein
MASSSRKSARKSMTDHLGAAESRLSLRTIKDTRVESVSVTEIKDER